MGIFTRLKQEEAKAPSEEVTAEPAVEQLTPDAEPAAGEEAAATVTSEAPEGEAAAESLTTEPVAEATDQVSEEAASQVSTESLQAEASAEAPVIEASETPETPVMEASAKETVSEIHTNSLPEPVAAKRGTSLSQALVEQDRSRRYDRALHALYAGLEQLQLVTSLSQVAKERNLSAPLVSAFKAIPGFDAALESFPSPDLFNTVPEHVSSENNVLGLEAFDTALSLSSDTLGNQTSELVNAFESTLNGLAVTVPSLMDQLRDDRDDLNNSDITDEVLQDLPVLSISNQSFVTLLSTVETNLRTIEAFSADELRANPEKIGQEVENLRGLVAELGNVLGLGMGEYGLVETNRNPDYEPAMGTFATKQIDKAALMSLVSKAEGVLEALQNVTNRKEDLVAALTSEVADMPTTVHSDDVLYGKVEHVSLMSCYTTLVSKLVRESVIAVSMILTTADAVLDIDDGQNG